ncbi:unnamed protein product [Ectocarpus sp. 12 AP-2014]
MLCDIHEVRRGLRWGQLQESRVCLWPAAVSLSSELGRAGGGAGHWHVFRLIRVSK